MHLLRTVQSIAQWLVHAIAIIAVADLAAGYGGRETWNLYTHLWHSSFYDLFLQGQWGALAPCPLDPLLNWVNRKCDLTLRLMIRTSSFRKKKHAIMNFVALATARITTSSAAWVRTSPASTLSGPTRTTVRSSLTIGILETPCRNSTPFLLVRK